MCKVSIILPVYNVEKYIKKSIESVLNQTYTDFELLVIIDGSPDKSKQVAEEFSDSRIKIFEKENGGLSDARNYGLERAKGEFIYFMDSDDWVEPNLLEDNLKVIEEENLDVVIFGYIQDDEDIDGNVLRSIVISSGNLKFQKNDSNLIFDHKWLSIMGYAWNKLYRKSFLDESFLWFEKGTSLVEDILFNSQVYCATNTLRFNEKTYYHYINRDTITLMKSYHHNSFDLVKRKTLAIDKFLLAFQVVNRNEILALSQVMGVQYCVDNLFNSKNDLSFFDRTKQIELMLNDPLTIKHIHYYSAKSRNNRVYKMLIKHKKSLLIAIIAKFLK